MDQVIIVNSKATNDNKLMHFKMHFQRWINDNSYSIVLLPFSNL